ncbi:type II toxin-antitoxin system HicA family toxin [Dyadobacter fanqingshengii]|uniref:Type II toxin-antitoxin system HicA family toxin n=1 Tax=Dyadobacter fanqingshengii TaxID=2906443 RepID=A0A9X1P6H2_9BACT|nr:type II toxin-antitoxin system HicA family toxin [Dyadobacter fanqingshengii]MCF0038579.1 type II toxin-antitoxin system HicA family toxin [Dyadobacter fanqingshengii]USJ34588.1 type II toxin-antitoxin system HicA family toxin [Dyadobacter fanqingshengii]
MKSSELFKLLIKDGWFEVRQTGSHRIMRHSVKQGQLIVPFHGSAEVKKGLLSALLKQADIKTNKR